MAKVTLQTVKNWFKTGLKPSQAQFWDTWDSFWHKDDQIPIEKIEGIQKVYDAVNNHINSATAHAQILIESRIYPFGTFQIFKNFGNVNQDAIEIGDFATGFINAGTFMPFGIYLGGNTQRVESWDTKPKYYSTLEII